MTILQFENVSMTFASIGKPVLHNISYQMYSGDFVILLGSNGSGKSTLLKLLNRQYCGNSGRILLYNKSICSLPDKEFSSKVATLSQHCSDSLFDSLTVYENYLLIKNHTSIMTKHGSDKEFLKNYLLDYNPNLTAKLNIPVARLSGGEKQAFALALCLLNPPDLLLLDEHTSALDPKTSENIMQLTKRMIIKHNITCILTTHDLDIAMRYGNRILMLGEGKVIKTFNQQDKGNLTKEMLIRQYF